MKSGRVQAGLRMSEELNEKTTKAAKRLDISKNDFILLAIQEKLKRENSETGAADKEESKCQ